MNTSVEKRYNYLYRATRLITNVLFIICVLFFSSSLVIAQETAPEKLQESTESKEGKEPNRIENFETELQSAISDLRERIPERYRSTTFLMEDWKWAAIIVLLVAAYVIKLVSFVILKFIAVRLSKRLEFLSSSKNLTEVVNPAAYLILFIVIQIVLLFIDLSPPVASLVATILRLLMIVCVVMIGYRLVDVVVEVMLLQARRTKTTVDDLLIPLVGRICKVIVVLFGVVAVAELFDFNLAGLIAGLGIGGLAFALAAKDTVENLFGSITVFMDQPFSVSDYISIDGIEGTVEHVGLRSTRIRTPVNSLVTIPNSKIISTSVDNLGARRYRRIRTLLSLTYDTPAEKIEAFCEGIRELIRIHPFTRKDYYHVHFNEFAGSSLDVVLNVYLEVADYSAELKERESLLLNIIRLAEKLEIEFAFPTQTVHLASTPQDPFQAVNVDSKRETLIEEAKTAAKKISGNGEK